jgi:hypothetical protein
LIAVRDLARIPSLYATFSIWLLKELLRSLPAASAGPMPPFVVFIDEAQLLFERSPMRPAAFVELLHEARSKGVCIVLVVHDPLMTPESVHELLNFRIQHARRLGHDQSAFTEYACRYLSSDEHDAALVSGLGIGEALVSAKISDQGRVVRRMLIQPPASQMASDLIEKLESAPVRPTFAQRSLRRRSKFRRR